VFGENGTVKNNISGHCLTFEHATQFGSLLPCGNSASAQQWSYPELGSTGPIQLKTTRVSMGRSGAAATPLCLDATALPKPPGPAPPPPAPVGPKPGRPTDAKGADALAFIDAGSESDLAADVPTLNFTFATLRPNQASSALFFAPPSSNGSTCAADPAVSVLAT
jgi:hypothetical protein